MELGGCRPVQLRRGQPALERGLLDFAVDGAVVDALQPGTEELVELAQVLGPAVGLELDSMASNVWAACPLRDAVRWL